MYKYEFFISYSRADYLDENNNIISDSPVAVLIKALDDSGISYWIDVEAVNSADEYMAKISQAIKKSRSVLFISSNKSNGAESYWPIKEVLHACEKKKTIVPIKIDDTEFHESIDLALAGLDVVEFYKNEAMSINKLIKLANNNSPDYEDVFKLSWQLRLKRFSLIGLIGLFLCFLLVSVFFAIGFCDGYFSNHEDMYQEMNNAFRERKVVALDNHTIKYIGESIKFTYDFDTDKFDIILQEERSFWENVTIKNILTSASISFAFDRMLNKMRFTSNGKYKAYYFVVGTIGILCGYTLGEQVGTDYAIYKNEKSLEEYFKVDSNKQYILNKIKSAYRNETP